MTETHDESDHQPAGLPDAEEISDEERERLEQERQERLDADNRADTTEVDNTERTFDPETGMFTDNPDHSEAERPYAAEDQP